MPSPLSEYRHQVDRLTLQYQHARQAVKDEKEAVLLAREAVQTTAAAQEVVQLVAQQIQQEAHVQIARVVSRCLHTIFEDPYEFKIEFDRKRGKTEARLIFIRDGAERDPTKAAGGGVVDCAAFALRLACLLLSRPKQRPLIVMDEPFKWVHPSVRRERVALMLQGLAEEMGVQFVMVTGIEELKSGKIIEVK